MANCPNCGKEIIQPERAPRKMYCDSLCYRDFRRKQLLQNKKTKTCLRCRTEYYPVSKRQRFCNLDCAREFRRMEKQIFSAFPFQDTTPEVLKLEKLGKNYRIEVKTENESANKLR